MLLILGTGVGAILLGSTLGYILGLRAGRKDKMDELLALQEEGWLSIVYAGDERQSSSQQLPKSLHTYTHSDDDHDDIRKLLRSDDDELKRIARTRRDSDERRGDWAKAIAQGRTDELLDDMDDE